MSQKLLTIANNSGGSVTVEVREISEKRYVVALHRDFNSGRMGTIRLEYDAEQEVYTDGTWSALKDDVWGVIAPEKLVRVKKPRNYSMGKAVCKGNNCPT